MFGRCFQVIQGHGTKAPATCTPALAFAALHALNTGAGSLLEVPAHLPPASLPFFPRQGPVADGSICWTLVTLPQTFLELISKIILYCRQGRFVFIMMVIPSFL